MFERIIASATLRAAWEKVKSNAGGPGGDGMTLSDFESGLDARLAALAERLAEGDYWPRPVRVVEIPKKRGGLRTLSIPSVVDRVAQTAAALVLTPALDEEFADSSFGFRPGRSVAAAARRVAALRREGYVWTVDGDIDDFFDEVPHGPLLARLARSVRCERTVDLVSRWLEAYGENGRGLPQGGPISPLLANLHLDDLDEQIEGGGVRLVRFADDFLLLCRSEAAAKGGLAKMTALLAGVGLRLNPERTRIRSFEESTRFLGHLFVRGLAMKELLDEEDGLLAPPPPGKIGVALAPEDGPGEAGEDLSARLRWLSVLTPGRVLTARNRAFSIRDEAEGAELAAVPPGWADAIEIGPAAMVEDDALRLAIATRTPIMFTGGDGALLATLDPAPADRAALHLAQARHALDPALRAALAGRFVEGRVRNQRGALRKLNLRRKDEAVAQAAHAIGRLARRARMATGAEEAMAVEAQAGALYWPALGACLMRGMAFDVRVRRPPTDPANLLLSFLSTRLTGDMAALILRRGLHPGFAVLHAVQDGRPNLALDLVEEFRAPVAERLCVYVLNNRILKPEDFVPRESGGLTLLPEGARRLVREYERWMRAAIRNPRDGRRSTWRGLMEGQILAYMRHVRGVAPYEPYVIGERTARDPVGNL